VQLELRFQKKKGTTLLEQTLKKQLVVPFCSPRFSFEVDPKFFFFILLTKPLPMYYNFIWYFKKTKNKSMFFKSSVSPTLGTFFKLFHLTDLIKYSSQSQTFWMKKKKMKFLKKLADLMTKRLNFLFPLFSVRKQKAKETKKTNPFVGKKPYQKKRQGLKVLVCVKDK